MYGFMLLSRPLGLPPLRFTISANIPAMSGDDALVPITSVGCPPIHSQSWLRSAPHGCTKPENFAPQPPMCSARSGTVRPVPGVVKPANAFCCQVGLAKIVLVAVVLTA